jgi:spermidine/putrescine transport system substrate-binding protein
MVDFSSSGLPRRALLSGAAGLGIAVALSGCGVPGKAPSSSASRTPQAAVDLSDSEQVVNWSNWPQYIDIASGGRRPTLDAFTKKTGITVNYNADYNDNDEFFAKVRPLLDGGKDTGRDLWVSTDWMVARMIRMGYLLPLDKANIPNAANLEPSLANPEFDPGCVYSLPWQVTFAGIGYNPDATDGKKISTIDQLLHDSSLKGKVTLLTEMRDTVGQVMIEQGVNLASFTAENFNSAMAVLEAAKAAGQIRAFTGNDYTKPLASGDTAACLAWAGDVVQLKADNPRLGFELPAVGFSSGSDNLVIPAMARHKKNAEKLINYYYDPEVMAKVVSYINYVGPVTGVKQIIAKDDPSLAKDELIFPSEEVMAKGQIFRSLTSAEETSFSQQFQNLVTG